MSHHYNILTNTLNTFAPLSFCCMYLANPNPEWSLLLAFTTHWWQSSWALPETVNKADPLSHCMFMTTDFNEVSTLLDNPTVSGWHAFSHNYLFISIFYFFQTLDFCPSHLQGNSQQMTLPTLNELYSSYSCFLSNIIEHNISGMLCYYLSLSSLSQLYLSHGHLVYFIHWDSTWNFFTKKDLLEQWTSLPLSMFALSMLSLKESLIKGVVAPIIRIKTTTGHELDITHITTN